MTKIRLTGELIHKAKMVFDKNTTVLTGEGLTRGELRRLVNAKRLKRRLVLVGNQYRCYYMRPGTCISLKELDKQKRQREEKVKQELKTKPRQAKKLGLFVRIWLFIKKLLGGHDAKLED